MVRVVIGIKDGYEKVPFRFPDMGSAGKFMEIAHEAAEKEISFRVTIDEPVMKGEEE